VLRFCQTPRAAAEIQAVIGFKHTTYFRRTYLVPLLSVGYLAMTVPDKPRSRMQRYQTTERGAEWLKALELDKT
jgi:ATP-dependent DNA helicase RecG